MKNLVLIGIAFGLGCAAISSPEPGQSIDWEAVDEKWSIHIVTTDEDGDDRVTRIWLALEGGEGILRTGNSRWWKNLQRDPRCRLRFSGIDYPLQVEFVKDPAAQVRIDDAFLAKYGWWEQLLFPQERGETHENYARLRSIR